MVEGALILASIIVGLAIADELLSLHRLLRARAVVQWDWAAPVVALLVLLTVIQVWWSVAQPADGPITIGEFLPVLFQLILMFLLAAAALPDEVPEDGLSLRSYYHRNGPYIWTLFSLSLGWALIDNAADVLFVGDRGITLIDLAIELAILALMISLIFIRKRWWHAIVLVVLYLGPIGWLSRSLA